MHLKMSLKSNKNRYKVFYSTLGVEIPPYMIYIVNMSTTLVSLSMKGFLYE